MTKRSNLYRGNYGPFAPRIVVYLPCEGAWVNELDVVITDCEEDVITGADIVTFLCPTCNKSHKSQRRGS